MKPERRAVSRYRIKLPVELEMENCLFETSASVEISIGGISVICEGHAAGRVLNQYIQVTPGENITANILIKIPQSTGLHNNVRCLTRVISVNRISQLRYVVGLKYLSFEQNSQQYLNEYIATLS